MQQTLSGCTWQSFAVLGSCVATPCRFSKPKKWEIRLGHINWVYDEKRSQVDLGSALGNRDDALPRLGLNSRDKQVGRAVAGVFVVLFGRCMGRHGQRLAAMTDELQTLLVNADHGLLAASRLGIQGQQVVHPISVLLRQRPDAPHQPTPRLEVVFLTSDERFRDSHCSALALAGPRVRARLSSSADGPQVVPNRPTPSPVLRHPCRTAQGDPSAPRRTLPAQRLPANTPPGCAIWLYARFPVRP
jgi:hypothetical protein